MVARCIEGNQADPPTFPLSVEGFAMTIQTATKLQIIVHYVAAEQPFKDDAEPSETVGHLKGRVLAAFGLSEGQDASDNTVTYTLYHGKTPLEDVGRTLGDVAGHAHALSLNLVQQITQGAVS
jgi:hypothetical protein